MTVIAVDVLKINIFLSRALFGDIGCVSIQGRCEKLIRVY